MGRLTSLLSYQYAFMFKSVIWYDIEGLTGGVADQKEVLKLARKLRTKEC